MDTLKTSSRKARRLESKKKKAAAFLALLDTKMTDQKCSETMSPGSDNESQKEDVLQEMKRIVRERKRQAMQKPKVFLTLEAMIQFRALPEEPVKEEELPPLFAMDLQQLLLYGLQGNSASYKPRWCKLLRVGKVSSVVLLMLEGISYNDYEKNKSNFPFISGKFVSYVEMVCPRQYNKTVNSELYSVPLSVSQLKKVNVKVPQNIKDSVVAKIGQPVGIVGTEKLSRTCLLLSTYQMMLEGYPLPVHTNIGRYHDFVFTKDSYTKVTARSPIFAVDCEMCTTAAKKNELTRVSIISENGEVLYDTLVKPKSRIINYLTRFSGITKEMLEPVTTTLEDVQREIRKILPADAILCGQSLNGDLMALKMFHPYVVDTSIIFNMSGNRGVKAGLRKLSQFFLGRSIQDSKQGHSSTEDASATLDLVKLKLSKGLEFGDATLSGTYFPDIHTYFMASESGNPGAIENVEQDEDTQPVLKKSDSSSHTQCALNTSKTNCSEAETLPSAVDKDSECSGAINITSKQDSIKFSGDRLHTPSKKASSVSSSSSDESDSSEGTKSVHENALPCTKKRKLNDPSETKSHPGIGCMDSGCTSVNKQEADISDSESQSIVKCKDYSFVSTTELVDQQKQCLFSQENSVHVSHSFFRLVYEAGRSGCVIDREAVISKYQGEPIETVAACTDTEVRRTAKLMVQSKEFVWANFRGYSDELEIATQQRKEKLMRKLDNRVHSVIKNAKENALIAVVMTGRDADDIPQNMVTFITTT